MQENFSYFQISFSSLGIWNKSNHSSQSNNNAMLLNVYTLDSQKSFIRIWGLGRPLSENLRSNARFGPHLVNFWYLHIMFDVIQKPRKSCPFLTHILQLSRDSLSGRIIDWWKASWHAVVSDGGKKNTNANTQNQ